MKISNCRNCGKKNLIKLFTLGNQYFTGKFIKYGDKVKKAPINLSICKKCKLVQLKDRYNLKYMYGPDYGYRTGINKTMSLHVKKITKILSKKVNLKKNDFVLDIASNDGTLLNYYNRNIKTFGIDPVLDKYKLYYKNIDYKKNDFFNKNAIKSKTKNKFKIITALSVFYDLNNPNKFLKDVHDILDENGLFLLEFADLASLIKLNMFDTICHEHAEYYSTKVLTKMFEKNDLRLLQINKNDINGASKQFLLSKKNSKFKSNNKNIINILKEEKLLKLDDPKMYSKFFTKIKKIGKELKTFLDRQIKKNKVIHGYGASTKGNTLLQFFKIGQRQISFISDRNPDKYGLKTPGTNITIISEKKSRSLKPDFYLVLPWHFKKEILKREIKIRKKGTRFIFPLPKLTII
tara:strand:- start:65 stop:1282 length:1218 start_codon:yes stop_codon:yes gene_type:complete